MHFRHGALCVGSQTKYSADSFHCGQSFLWLSLRSYLPSPMADQGFAIVTHFRRQASKFFEVSNDSKTKIRQVSPVLSQEGCENRPAAQPWHVQYKESRTSA